MSKYTVSVTQTSNPKIVKFEADKFLTQHESFEYNNVDEAKNSKLVQQLFYLPFVKKVYVSGNFIAIERFDIVEWSEVQDEVAEQIQAYINTNAPIVEASSVKKTAITVYAESTPNPTVLKFVCNKKLVDSIFEFTSIDDASSSPLATKLFHFPFVKSVFFDQNYVSITKFDVAEWNDITLELREFIKSHLENGEDVVLANAIQTTQEATKKIEAEFEALDDTSKQIVNIIEEYVKPAVASDGGNIQFESYDEDSKRVRVILQGACSGCPSSTFTLKNGIENMLREMLNGKVETVEAING